jgi:hypothetical protein
MILRSKRAVGHSHELGYSENQLVLDKP